MAQSGFESPHVTFATSEVTFPARIKGKQSKQTWQIVPLSPKAVYELQLLVGFDGGQRASPLLKPECDMWIEESSETDWKLSTGWTLPKADGSNET
jgi:hypothetical protein